MSNGVAFVLPPFRGSARPALPEEKYFWNAQWARRNRTMGWDLRGALRADSRGPVTFDQPEVPLGVIYLAPYLEEVGWKVELVDLWDAGPGELNQDYVREVIQKVCARIFLFSCFTNNYVHARDCARIIKETHPGSLCIIGGAHVTGWPNEALRDGFDLVISGEGEVALQKLAQVEFDRAYWSQIPGARFLDSQGAVQEASVKPPPFKDFGPLPSYHLLPPRYRSTYYARLFTAHGCPFRCTFCSDVLWTGMRPRLKKRERIIQELDLIQRHVQFKEIYVSDETFTVRKEHAVAAAEILSERGIVWGCETRADLVDNAILARLADFGCVEIDFGIESLAEPVLRKAKKKIFKDRVEAALRETSAAGIRTHVNLMVGLPGETEATARETIDRVCEWISQDIVSTVDYFVTTPYPGSDIFDRAGEFGLTLLTRDWRRYREDDLPVYDLPDLSAGKIFQLWREGLNRLARAMEEGCAYVKRNG